MILPFGKRLGVGAYAHTQHWNFLHKELLVLPKGIYAWYTGWFCSFSWWQLTRLCIISCHFIGYYKVTQKVKAKKKRPRGGGREQLHRSVNSDCPSKPKLKCYEFNSKRQDDCLKRRGEGRLGEDFIKCHPANEGWWAPLPIAGKSIQLFLKIK